VHKEAFCLDNIKWGTGERSHHLKKKEKEGGGGKVHFPVGWGNIDILKKKKKKK